MKNKYVDIMNKIKVTDEMKIRIIENLNEKKDGKFVNTNNYKKYFSIVACICLIFIAGLSIRNIVYNQNNDGMILDRFEVLEHDTLKSLSKTVGFKVKDIDYPAMELKETKYISIGKKLAEINYIEAENTVTFRMARSREDVSGDYNFYDDMEEVRVGNSEILLKGNEGKYNLAVWQSDEFSYSLSSEKSLSRDEFINILKAIK